MTDLSVELGLTVLLGLLVAFARSISQWWQCRTPLGRVNYELAQQRARRRR